MSVNYWNPADKDAGVTLTNLNRTAVGSSWKSARALLGFETGKWYWELRYDSVATDNSMIGVLSGAGSLSSHIGSSQEGWGMFCYNLGGEQYHNNAQVSKLGTISGAGAILMVAIDMDNHKLWFGIDGTWLNSGDPAAGTGAIFDDLDKSPLYPAISTGAIVSTVRFSNPIYSPPSGFSMWDNPFEQSYLYAPRRDRFRTIPVSMGEVEASETTSFLSDRRNRFRRTGVSLGPATSPFFPTGLSGIKCWVDANAITGKNDGDAIQTWPDQSGNSNDFSQAEAGYSPLYKTNIVNGLPALLFDASNDKMDSPSISNIAFVAVVAKYTDATFSDYKGLLTGDGANPIFIGNGSGQSTWYTGEAPTRTLYKDGVTNNTGVAGDWHYFYATTTAWTDVVRIGADRGNGRYWKGHIAEIVLCDAVPDSATLAKLSAYFASKYGI